VSKLTAAVRRNGWLGVSRLPHWAQAITGHRFLRVHGSPAPCAEASSIVFPESSGSVGRNIDIFADDTSEPEPVVFPPLRIWKFEAAQIVHNSRFNAVLVRDKLLLSERREAGHWALYKGRRPRRVGMINGQSREIVAMRNVRPEQRLPQALFIGTRAPYNWYHWIANVLPALYVANSGSAPADVPLVLPDEIKAFPQMMESLEIFLNDREIFWLSKDRLIDVGRVYWADSPVYDAPFSQQSSNRMPLVLHREAMVGYTDRILDHYATALSPLDGPQKVFLGRSSDAARPYNSDEVEGWAQEEGFALCFTDHISLLEQIALFRNATHIVGPTGAAWSGLIFAQSHLRALRLHGGAAEYENYFSNLATISGATIFDLQGENLHPGIPDDAFRVTRHDFSRAIRKLLGN